MRRLALLAILISSAAASAATTVLGDWRTPTGSIIRVETCGVPAGPDGSRTVCLKIVQLSPSAPETTDKQNPNASLRSRPLCGLTIGTGFHRDDPAHLSDGHLYDPQSGRTYQGEISAEGADLKLRGYIGIPFFGRTEVWRRASPDAATCR